MEFLSYVWFVGIYSNSFTFSSTFSNFFDSSEKLIARITRNSSDFLFRTSKLSWKLYILKIYRALCFTIVRSTFSCTSQVPISIALLNFLLNLIKSWYVDKTLFSLLNWSSTFMLSLYESFTGNQVFSQLLNP